jgi:cyclophilin family peptidyl-prolyl cis-trans isomerase
MGTIVLELNREKAPITVDNFIQYVKSGHYNGTVFHRVIQNFMIQGGGFELTDDKLIEKATKPGIKNESTNGLRNQRGSIAMARTADPDSASAQFFINVVDNSMLDYPNNGGYAVFGKVLEGMDVVDQIKAVSTGSSTLSMLHPMTGQRIDAPASDVPRAAVIILEASVD